MYTIEAIFSIESFSKFRQSTLFADIYIYITFAYVHLYIYIYITFAYVHFRVHSFHLILMLIIYIKELGHVR